MPINSDPAELLRRVLSADAARLVVAIVSMAIGLASILVQWMRRKTQDRVRLWFGLLALLYGYRALLMTNSARYFLTRGNINFQIAFITFTIGIPAILFGWGLVSKTQNNVTKSLLALNGLMAATFLVFFWNGSVVRALFVANNVLVITFTLAMIVYLFVAPAGSVPELKTLRVVVSIWGLFVIYNNIRPWLPARRRLRVCRIRCVPVLAGLAGGQTQFANRRSVGCNSQRARDCATHPDVDSARSDAGT